jgi:hypothetical protein
LVEKWDVSIWDTQLDQAIVALTFAQAIIGVKINLKHLCLMQRDEVLIFKLRGIALTHKIKMTNHLGRVVMGANSSNFCPFLIYSDSLSEGLVTVHDLDYMARVRIISAHEEPILRLNINFQGNLMVTISTRATIIRVFNLSTGSIICTYSTDKGI